MRSTRAIVGVTFAAILLAGSAAYAFAHAPENGSMGVWGYVASPRDASLALPESQPGATSLEVAHVSSPEPAWVVVHLEEDGMPGKRVGLLHVPKGISAGLSVKLSGFTGEKLIVAVHADRGTPDRFDFDMEKKEISPDRPFFVGGAELARVVSVK